MKKIKVFIAKFMFFLICAFPIISINKITVSASEDASLIIIDENLSLCLLREKPVETHALEIYKPTKYYDSITFYSTDGKHSAEVQYTLIGGYWYDSNTFQVTRTSDPTFSIVSVVLDASVQLYPNSISTGSNISDGKGYFWGSFELNAGYYFDGVWINDIPFDTCRVSFHATP